MRHPSNRLRIFVLVLMVVGTSCVRSITAYFANPCPESLTATTYDHTFPSAQGKVKTFELAPTSVTEVKDAFVTVAGFDWAMTLEDAKTIVRVDGDSWLHNTVVIPAEVCAEI